MSGMMTPLTQPLGHTSCPSDPKTYPLWLVLKLVPLVLELEIDPFGPKPGGYILSQNFIIASKCDKHVMKIFQLPSICTLQAIEYLKICPFCALR